jgi:hypothetical protein
MINTIFGIEYDFPKDYLRIVNRFMKEVGLYRQWKQFLQTPPHNPYDGFNIYGFNGRHTNWTQKRVSTVVNVVGKTNFTDYLKYCCNIILPDDVCVYELFAAYLSVFEPSMIKDNYDLSSVNAGRKYLNIDREKRKVSIKC